MHAFIDESRRGREYMLMAAVVADTQLKETRRLMRSWLLPGQSVIHFGKESDRRKRELNDKNAGLPVQIHLHVELDGTDVLARVRCWESLVPRLCELGVARFLVESREGQDHADRRVLFRLLNAAESDRMIAYTHLARHEEPGLWIADAAGWAYGRGGDYRRRVLPICAVVTVGSSQAR